MGGKFNRKSMRLRNYDYAQDGAYFITICTYKKIEYFGRIVDGGMELNDMGKIVDEEWTKTSTLRSYVLLDKYQIMPNHFHGIIHLRRGTARRAPTVECFGKPVPGSIPTIIRSFKSSVTKRINNHPLSKINFFWQRNYYDHIIRNDLDLTRIRHYILQNPLKWEMDRYHPANI